MTPNHADLGIGARITLAPMADNFLTILLTALNTTPAQDVTVTSDEVSTHVAGTEDAILAYLRNLIVNVAAHGVHTVAQITLSRGCPGAVTCSSEQVTAHAPSGLTALAPTGLDVSAQWSLYPLLDNRAGSVADHMEPIMAAINRAKASGIALESKHFITELRGDVAAILNTIGQTWVETGALVPHVVTTATINILHPAEHEIDAARAALTNGGTR